METTIQILYDKGLFKRLDNADEVLKDHLRIEVNVSRRSDLGPLNEIITKWAIGSTDNVYQWFMFINTVQKNKARAILKLQQNLSSLSLGNVRIFLTVYSFFLKIESVKSTPRKRTHWVAYSNQNYFDSYGRHPPDKPPNFVLKRTGHCLDSEYKLPGLGHKNDSYSAAFLKIIYLTKN